MPTFRIGWKKLAIGLVLFAASLTSHAFDSASFELGGGDKVQMARIGLQWDWNKRWLSSNGTHIGGYWDLTLGHWRATEHKNDPDRTQHITLLGITPVLRFQRNSKIGFYAEAGIGAHLMSELYDNNGDQLSTSFQFGDHIGAGYVFGNKLDIGFKYQHFSNGSIKKPNDGVDFAILKASYPF